MKKIVLLGTFIFMICSISACGTAPNNQNTETEINQTENNTEVGTELETETLEETEVEEETEAVSTETESESESESEVVDDSEEEDDSDDKKDEDDKKDDDNKDDEDDKKDEDDDDEKEYEEEYSYEDRDGDGYADLGPTTVMNGFVVRTECITPSYAKQLLAVANAGYNNIICKGGNYWMIVKPGNEEAGFIMMEEYLATRNLTCNVMDSGNFDVNGTALFIRVFGHNVYEIE